MKPPVKKKLLWINICLVLAVLLLCPTVVNKGSGDGLLLWFTVVLPALFPFMVFSGVMMKIGATQTIGHYLYPVFHRLLGLSENGCYAMAVGFLSGYPLGGKTAADLLRQNAVTPAEAQYILCFLQQCQSYVFAGIYRGILSWNEKAVAGPDGSIWNSRMECGSFFAEKYKGQLSNKAKCGRMQL